MENMLDDLFVYDIDSSPRSNFIQIFVCEKIFLSESGLGILVNIQLGVLTAPTSGSDSRIRNTPRGPELFKLELDYLDIQICHKMLIKSAVPLLRHTTI